MPFLLDTVTVSTFRRLDKADPNVVRWQKTQRGQVAYISVITLNEIRYGLKKVELSDSVFAGHLATWYNNIVSLRNQFHILNVDRPIAELAAVFRAAHHTPIEDSLIAATAQVHGLTLATRNTADFQACGIRVVNPWE
jgi:toxin FitB